MDAVSSPNGHRPLAAVTGASSGIGYELARQFVDHGFDVVAIAENDGVVEAARSLSSDGSTVTPIQADLRDYDEVERVYEALRAIGRPLDAIALNAGVGVAGRFVETELDDDLGLIALNVTSTVHLAKRILADMARRGSGRALFTASVASTMPGPYYATYAASKSFVLSFAEAVRYELKDAGVTVTALMPGPTDTDFFRRAGLEDTKVGEAKKDDAATVAADGFEALMKGDDQVIAGSAKNAAQVIGGKVLPDTAKAAMHARQTEPRTKS